MEFISAFLPSPKTSYLRQPPPWLGLPFPEHLTFPGQGALQGPDGILERLAQHPALTVGDGIKGVDRLRPRLDVELDVAAGPEAAVLPLGPRPGRRHGPRLAAAEVGPFRHRPDFLERRCGRLVCLRREAADVQILFLEDAGALTSHHATSAMRAAVPAACPFSVANTSAAKARASVMAASMLLTLLRSSA